MATENGKTDTLNTTASEILETNWTLKQQVIN